MFGELLDRLDRSGGQSPPARSRVAAQSIGAKDGLAPLAGAPPLRVNRRARSA